MTIRMGLSDDEIVACIGRLLTLPQYQQYVLAERFYWTAFPRPASVEDFEQCERDIGLPLPHLLKRLYTEVANVGFGPGLRGLWGVNTSERYHRDNGEPGLGSDYVTTRHPWEEIRPGLRGQWSGDPDDEEFSPLLFWPYGLVCLTVEEEENIEANLWGVHCLLEGFPIIRVDNFCVRSSPEAIPEALKFPGSEFMGASCIESPSLGTWLNTWLVETCKQLRIETI